MSEARSSDAAPARPRILCVDDDGNVLQGFRLHLRKEFEVLTAENGADGLETLQRYPDIAVVVSDMRMPNMDGAEFLGRVREMVPSAIRVLLTGFSDFDSAIKAVNEGQIFRFLSKPCPPEQLKAVMKACVDQYELVRTERTLLNHTLLGCVKVMLELAGMAAPPVRRKAARLRERVSAIAKANELRQRWQLELAASLSQLGELAVLETNHVANLSDLDESTSLRLAEANARVVNLIRTVPRLGPVAALLEDLGDLSTDSDRRSRLLGALIAIDELEGSGTPLEDAVAHAQEQFGSDVGELLANLDPTKESPKNSVELDEAAPGMVLAEDVRTKDGVLLALEGIALDVPTIEHILAHRSLLGAGAYIVARPPPA